MRATYDTESDVLMFVLKDELSVNAISEPGGVIVSYGEDDEPISIEFLNESKRQLFNPAQEMMQIYRYTKRCIQDLRLLVSFPFRTDVAVSEVGDLSPRG